MHKNIINLDTKYKVACHTDNVGPGTTFVAIKGTSLNGIDYIPKAIELGATCVVIEHDAELCQEVSDQICKNNIEIIRVDNARKALSNYAAKAYGYPAKSLKIIGVTGTKGKTTTSFLLEHILSSCGYKTALTSTVKNRILGVDYNSSFTTAQPDYLHMFLASCVSAGVEYVVMEVSAQALTLDRVADIIFDGVVFTNFSLEHSEFYTTIDDYFNAKLQIFSKVKSGGFALVNNDNQYIKNLENMPIELSRFGLSGQDNLFACAQNIKTSFSGTYFDIQVGSESCTIESSSLIGQFNIYNMLAAFSVAKKLGIENGKIQETIASFKSVPGRLQQSVLPNGAMAIIDYASNPESFESVLSMLSEFTDSLIVVFGAGGDRDKTKRPLMGEIAIKYASHVILTTDNPRSESASDITQDILGGVSQDNMFKVTIELDREIAIKLAYSFAKSTSIIALLGKGPDEYQLINGQKTFFSESSILTSLCK